MEMTIEHWKKFIDSNFSNDKLEVLFNLVESRQLKYSEFSQLLEYIQESK